MESQGPLHMLEDLSQVLCSNKFVSSREVSRVTRSLTECQRRLQGQVENDIERWLNVQDVMRAFQTESHNIETSLMTVETFLHQSTLPECNSTAINSRSNEIQVNSCSCYVVLF